MSEGKEGEETFSSILIIGAGVFGLSTALTLLSSPRYHATKITLLDPSLPSGGHENLYPPKYAASVDSSRIVRPDYASPAYSTLAAKAQEIWRRDYGTLGIYHESGLAVVAEDGTNEAGAAYVRAARANVSTGAEDVGAGEGAKVQLLRDKEDIRRVLKGAGGASGSTGYVNWSSGWADAAAAMSHTIRKVQAYGERVDMVRGRAARLLSSSPASQEEQQKRKVVGAQLEGGAELRAEAVILAAGAWSGNFLDLRGRAEARGQVVTYMRVNAEERRRLAGMPVLLNLGTGMFVIPPPPLSPSASSKGSKEGGMLKVARHGFGYRNLTPVPNLSNIQVSLPHPDFSTIPAEGRKACRRFLTEAIPWLAHRPFCEERLCYYTDTPTGDFLIDWHPEYDGLFLATGGSGHGFKFLPVLGGCIGEIFERRDGEGMRELKRLWAWRDGPEEGGAVECRDGSRGGPRGMMLSVEMAKGGSL